jgi:hypothetical protein
MRRPRTSKVRIATLSSSPASGLAKPIAPVYASRPVDSSSAITSSAASFGAPVTEPGGNAARSSPASPTPSRSSPSTSETMCQTPACGRTSASAVTRTVPGRQTRPRSLRTRSTIITFSARSFSDASSSAWPPAGRVPLIGALRTVRPERVRNTSGERLATVPHGPATNAARSVGSASAAVANRSNASPSSRPERRMQRLAWNRSPARIRVRHASTAAAWPRGDGVQRQSRVENARGGRGAAIRAASSSRRLAIASARSGVTSASNHHRPAASSRSRWS